MVVKRTKNAMFVIFCTGGYSFREFILFSATVHGWIVRQTSHDYWNDSLEKTAGTSHEGCSVVVLTWEMSNTFFEDIVSENRSLV